MALHAAVRCGAAVPPKRQHRLHSRCCAAAPAKGYMHAAVRARRACAPFARHDRSSRGVARRSLPHAAASPATASPVEQLKWRESWWPVAFEQDLDASVPTPLTLLGEAIVLWKENDAWRAYADRCPHRLAPLSEGRINDDGRLECPYHGWAFEGPKGECVSVPQDREGGIAKSSARACVSSFPVRVAQGIVFVLPTVSALPGGLPSLPIVDELDDPAFVVIDICRDLPYDYVSLLENVLDVSHVPFVHHLTVSNRANAGPVDLEVLGEVSGKGFEGLWAEGPRRGKLGPQHTRFLAPSLMVHSLSAPSLGTTLTVVYATPSAPGRVRLLARFPFRFNSALPRLIISNAPRWVQHIGQNGVLEDDQVMLHKGERTLQTEIDGGKSFAQACYMPLAADAYVIAFRKWFHTFGGGGPSWPAGVSAALPPATEPREALLDRYNGHTRNCAACMKALRGVRLAHSVAWALGAVAAMFAACSLTVAALLSGNSAAMRAPLLAAAYGLGAGLLSLIAVLKLKSLETAFIIGSYPPPRNKLIPARKKGGNRGSSIKLV